MTRSREQRLNDLLDKEEIREALHNFCRGMDRFDHAAYTAAFHPDAVMAAGPYVGDPQGCWEWAMPMHRDWQVLTQHAILNNTIALDGDSAHSETYYLFVARNRPAPGSEAETLWLAGGRYVDRFERRDGAWKIALRTNVIEWASDAPPMPLPFADVADLALNGVSARDTSDPSYQRPLVNKRALTN